MLLLETPRLTLRPVALADAPFIRELVNDPDFLRNVGDRGVRTVADAETYLREGALASYARSGLGLFVIEPRERPAQVGVCSLVRREGLADVDIGYALLPAHRGRGYALEATAAVLEHARSTLGLAPIVAVTTPANYPSIKLLRALGLRFDRHVRLPGGDEALALYTDAPAQK